MSMRFLLLYSDAYEAKRKGWPPSGSILEVSSLDDLIGLSERFDNNRLILERSAKAQDYAVFWLEAIEGGYWDADEQDSFYTVAVLPPDWRDLRQIEVYNGYRE